MTAPVAPVAPVQTPAPTQEGRYGVEDAMQSVLNDALKATLAETGTTPEGEAPAQPETAQPTAAKPEDKGAEPTTRADGATWNATANRWQKDGKFVAGEAPKIETPAVTEAIPAEPAVEEIALPEGFAAVKKIEGRELATAFKVMDADGELEVPDVMIEFNAAGKTRKEPLDKVVKLAQWGYANQEREQRIEQARVQAETVQSQNQQLIEYARKLEAERERLLSDPDFLVQTLAQFEHQNSPEAKLARAEAQNQQLQQQREFEQYQQQGTTFFNGEVVPAVETIAKSLPLVSEEEIGAKMLLLSDRFKVQTPFGSLVPPQKYQAVRDALLNELVPWAQQLHETRESDRKAERQQTETQRKQAEAEVRTAQTQAQRKTNLVTRVLRPGTKAGSAPSGTATRQAPPKKPIVSVQDAEEAALRDALAASLSG